MSRLSETHTRCRLSFTALRFACTVLLRLSLSEAFLHSPLKFALISKAFFVHSTEVCTRLRGFFWANADKH